MGGKSKLRENAAHNPKFIMINDRKFPLWPAIRIGAIYLAFGLAWIVFSDKAMNRLVTSMELRHEIEIWKGFFFVGISAVVIFTLVAGVLKRLSDRDQIIVENRDELRAMAYYDSLTGLHNRRKLYERLPLFMADDRDSAPIKALLYLNIDNSKLINDTMGHSFGDTFIRAVASRICDVLESDEEIFRPGGDEFIVLLPARQMQDVKARAETLVRVFSTPLSVDGMTIHTSVSVGVAYYPGQAGGPGELLKCADIALFNAKKNGKNRISFFTIAMMAPINERMKIGEKLHQALSRNEFEVYFQPQIRTDSGIVASVEALLRWKNGVLGEIPPDKFIPVAEETLLIVEIGEWVLRTACAFAKRMHLAGFPDLGVSVNISMVQLLQEDFSDLVRSILESTGIDPIRLELEITESILMDSRGEVLKHLASLKALGIGIALDDFGKGYSSLSYLEQLPLTVLKIDKIFVDSLTGVRDENSLAGNIVGIGKKLGLEVIAEGVENEGQVSYLAGQKCDKIQGWVYSKALPATEAERFIRDNRAKITAR